MLRTHLQCVCSSNFISWFLCLDRSFDIMFSCLKQIRMIFTMYFSKNSFSLSCTTCTYCKHSRIKYVYASSLRNVLEQYDTPCVPTRHAFQSMPLLTCSYVFFSYVSGAHPLCFHFVTRWALCDSSVRLIGLSHTHGISLCMVFVLVVLRHVGLCVSLCSFVLILFSDKLLVR